MQYYVNAKKQEAFSTLQEGRSVTSFEKRVDTKAFNDGESRDRAEKKVPEKFVLFPSQEPEPEGLQKMDDCHVRQDKRERIGLRVRKGVLNGAV